MMSHLEKFAAAYSQWTDHGDGPDDETLERFDAHIDGENAGYLTAHPGSDGKHIWFKGLHVSPEHQKKGIARELIRRALEHYEGQDIMLRPRPYKNKALTHGQLKDFYGSFGFETQQEGGRGTTNPMIRRAQ